PLPIFASWKQGVRKGRIVSLQSAQKRSAHSGTDFRFGERPQGSGKDEYFPAWKPAEDGASGAVRPYSRHVNGYSWNFDAIPASSASDVIAAVQPVSTPRLSDTDF